MVGKTNGNTPDYQTLDEAGCWQTKAHTCRCGESWNEAWTRVMSAAEGLDQEG